MSRFKSKQEFLDDVYKERAALDKLLASIPDARKTEVVIDDMSVKDFLAHRTEWARMMIRWYTEAKAGKQPAVPSEKYKWNQIKELNADIHERFQPASLEEIESEYQKVFDELQTIIEHTTEAELFDKKHYAFTGTSDLATYLNSASASHYRSARRHINKWWRSQSK
ncbi:MAG: ClbS/DfsB family four-helix bundle protein [Rhodococcus sp. (in: high G+C Gram-positive bacteria)]